MSHEPTLEQMMHRVERSGVSYSLTGSNEWAQLDLMSRGHRLSQFCGNSWGDVFSRACAWLDERQLPGGPVERASTAPDNWFLDWFRIGPPDSHGQREVAIGYSLPGESDQQRESRKPILRTITLRPRDGRATIRLYRDRSLDCIVEQTFGLEQNRGPMLWRAVEMPVLLRSSLRIEITGVDILWAREINPEKPSPETCE